MNFFWGGGERGAEISLGGAASCLPWNRPCKEHINAPNSEVCGDLFEDNVSGAFGRWSHGHVRLPVYDVLDGLAGLQAACGVNESCGDVLTDHLSQSNTTDLKSFEHRNPFRKKTLQTASKSAYKWQRNACSNYAPLERTEPGRYTAMTTSDVRPACSDNFEELERSRRRYCLHSSLHEERQPVHRDGDPTHGRRRRQCSPAAFVKRLLGHHPMSRFRSAISSHTLQL